MPVGEIHRSGNRPVEITHLRQDAFGIVIVSPQINLGSFDHQNKAKCFHKLSSFAVSACNYLHISQNHPKRNGPYSIGKFLL